MRGPGRDRGLTTLEWLLIAALVAALAGGAVLLLGQTVEAGETVASRHSEMEAARLVAGEVERDARAARAGDFDTWEAWEAHFQRRCSLIAVRLDLDGDGHNRFVRAGDGLTAFDEVAAAHADPPTATQAQARCTAT